MPNNFSVIGDISAFSYFKNIPFAPRAVYPSDVTATATTSAPPPPPPYVPAATTSPPPPPPPPPATYPPVNLYNEVLPPIYQPDAPQDDDVDDEPVESTNPPPAPPAQTYFSPEPAGSTAYTSYPPAPVTTPAPQPEPEPETAAPEVAEYETAPSSSPEPVAPIFRWRQLTQPESSYRTVYQANSYTSAPALAPVAPDTEDKKPKDIYVPNFITPSTYQQPTQTTPAPAPAPAPEPIFYFRDVVEEVKPEEPPQAPEEPPSPATEALTPSPVYYKPVAVPEPPSPRYPEPEPKPEPAPEVTPSPVYYKYPNDSASNPEESAPSSGQEPKSEAPGFGDFIDQADFQIPEVFRSFLNEPPKWINMKNW